MSLLSKIFGTHSSRAIKAIMPLVKEVNAKEESISKLSDSDLVSKTEYFKNLLKEGKSLNEILPEAFAVVREASKRTLGLRHFDSQIIGGIVLHDGKIAEMRTGEGKTLVATLPLYLNALTEKGVHLVTVNDYLSRRDAVWMGQIFSFLNISVGVINHDESFIYDPNHKDLDKKRDEVASYKVVHEFLRPASRKEAYACDITYGTNNEFGFDYLRDNISYRKEDLRQREFNFAIVDEIDSILIDEARTPLIISAPTKDKEDLYRLFSEIATKLVKDEDFIVDEKHRAIQMTDLGIEKAEKILGMDNIYSEGGIKYVHHLETAVRAKALFHKDKEYVVKDGEVIIIDEFTGRMQPGRRWSEGLHQAIESKEGLKINAETRTYASITFQNYFKLYKKLSGMTGTAKTSSEEFFKVYSLPVVEIPTNKPIARIDKNDLIFQTEKGKFSAIAKKVKELNQKGQPVLIGTVSIDKSELLSAYLEKEGVRHQILNAKNHEREGEIIANAGVLGGVTISTNMAGRGVDIKLGGIPFSEEKAEEVKKRGGLFVLGTERHEARRIDNQLRGRSGRQGDPGETQFFVSLEDSLMRVFASDLIKNMMGRLGIAEDEAIENRIITRSLETAQTRIEGMHFDARKHVLDFDNVLNHQRKIFYDRRRKILVGNLDEVEEVFLLITKEFKGEVSKVLDEKIKEMGRDNFLSALRNLLLETIDVFWMDHLEMMDYLRSSVNLRAYGQRDPLVEYKKEGLRLFKEMELAIGNTVLNSLHNLVPKEIKEEKNIISVHKPFFDIQKDKDQNKNQVAQVKKSEEKKIGRNDPCYCGSGKKYKKCHGSN